MELKNMNVATCPPCGESTLKGGKGVVNKETLINTPPSALCATSPAGGEVNNGFTLIELLVVVLIIGILAAVAVPQYQKAVVKSKNAQMKQLVKAVADAEQAYFLANGTYATNFNELDIDLPLTPVKTQIGAGNAGECSISTDGTDAIRQNQDYYIALNANRDLGTQWCNVVAYWRNGPYKCAGFGISLTVDELKQLHCRERATGGFYTAGPGKFCSGVEQGTQLNVKDSHWRFYKLP